MKCRGGQENDEILQAGGISMTNTGEVFLELHRCRKKLQRTDWQDLLMPSPCRAYSTAAIESGGH